MPGNLEEADHVSLPDLSGWICLSASATNMGFDTFDFQPSPREKTKERNMSTTALDPQRTEGTPAPLPHKPASTTTLALMGFAAVYIVWGSTYLAIRIGIESFPPLILAGLRLTFAVIFLYPPLRVQTAIKPGRANWVAAVITGTLLLFVGNGGVSWAEQSVPSGVTALLVATVSLWLVILDWLRPGGVKPVPRVVMGPLMGFARPSLLVWP